MTNFNPYNENQFQSHQSESFGHFVGPQAVYQPGFAGTNAQEVRQQIAQSGAGFQQIDQGSTGFQQSGSFGHFVGPQAAFQPGFSGTNAQEVRQQNAQSGAGFQQIGQVPTGFQQSGGGFGQFTGQQAAFQSGFAGTNAQEVRQQNAQSLQGGTGFMQTSQGPIGMQQSQHLGHFTGPQAVFQPGFSGTNAQEVRQQNAQLSQGRNSIQPISQGPTGMHQSNFMHFTGPQAAFQPGFAGTNAQEVRQQNAQTIQSGTGFQPIGQTPIHFQQSGQFMGPQAAFQPGFAGTNAQEVRQQNAQGGTGFQQTNQIPTGMQQLDFGQFTGSQAVFQSEFAGTDAQQVRQQNAQSEHNLHGGNSFLQ